MGAVWSLVLIKLTQTENLARVINIIFLFNFLKVALMLIANNVMTAQHAQLVTKTISSIKMVASALVLLKLTRLRQLV